MKRSVACTVVVFLLMGSLTAFAAKPSGNSEGLVREAFLRGGSAISEALLDATSTAPIVAADLIPAEAPKRSVPTAQAPEGGHRRLMTVVGIGIIGTIAVYLVQRSVKNHNKIFGSNN